MTDSITRLNPASLPNSSAMGYSQISIVDPGRLAFVSGQVAWSDNGAPAPDDLAEQAKHVFKNASTALASLGATTKDLVIVRIFATDLTPERLDTLFPLLVGWFDGAQPSVTGVGVAALAAPDLQLELEMTVRVP